MSHVKRETISKTWPVPRKGRKYVVVASHNKKSGIPLLVVMRDVLKVVEKRKELKNILHEKKVLVNNKQITEENYSLSLFDTLSLLPMKKHYRVELTNKGKIAINEIKESEANNKISKIAGKKILKNNVTQLNFNDGRNIISKEKASVGDSAIINFKDKKIEKIFPIKEKSEIVVIGGKHLGKSGIVKKIEGKEIIVSSDENELNIDISKVIVIK